MDLISQAVSAVSGCFGQLAPWARVPVLLAVFAALAAGGFRGGYILCLGAVLTAVAYSMDVESFANALNQGATGPGTVKLMVTLVALAWLGGVLREGGAVARLAAALEGLVPDPRGRGVVLPVLAGLVPGARPEAASAASTRGLGVPEAQRAALHVWFSRMPLLCLPVGAALVVAADLGGVPLPRLSGHLLPLALAMGAVGLLILARALPEPEAVAPSAVSRRAAFHDVLRVLGPVILAFAAAFTVPDVGLPAERARVMPVRLLEGMLGISSPLALGACLGALGASRTLGLGTGACLRALRAACTTELVVLVVGIRVFSQVAAAKLPFSAHPAGAVASALQDLAALTHPAVGPYAWTCLAFLLVPGLMTVLLGGALAGLAATLPFLAVAAGEGGVGGVGLVSLAVVAAFLAETLSRSGLAPTLGPAAFEAGLPEVRARLVLPAAALLLAAALLG